MKRSARELRRLGTKAARAVEALERRFGVPAWDGPEPPLDALVRTVLSQSTSDVNSGRAFETLKARFPTWAEAYEAGPAGIERAIRCGGLARQKSVRIHKLLGWVRQRFGAFDLAAVGEMPTEAVFEMLLPLEGIGVKTIAVMLMFACGRDCFAVDTHVHRIARRVGLVPGTASAERTFHLMRALVPAGKALSFHLNLLALGRTLCRPTGPRCTECPLRPLCDYAAQRRSRRERAT
ncbi:MAG TPA: endonuclease III [Planctomycetota bacterium]|nr:endonuclease III [Planctomycetota bacterium]HRR80426.1 endonuclease III [Planctomycetota bacterium]HRT94116.1 endonuclease III [Planctomycetota bacterium]